MSVTYSLKERKKKKLTKVAKRQQNLNGHPLRPSPHPDSQHIAAPGSLGNPVDFN